MGIVSRPLSTLSRKTAALALATALAASGGTALTTLTAAPAQAKTHKKSCKATVTEKNPKKYTSTTVKISKLPRHAKVSVSAHYKTTTNTKHVRTGEKTKVSVTYYVSGGTKNRRVPVRIFSKKGKKLYSCTTSYTVR